MTEREVIEQALKRPNVLGAAAQVTHRDLVLEVYEPFCGWVYFTFNVDGKLVSFDMDSVD